MPTAPSRSRLSIHPSVCPPIHSFIHTSGLGALASVLGPSRRQLGGSGSHRPGGDTPKHRDADCTEPGGTRASRPGAGGSLQQVLATGCRAVPCRAVCVCVCARVPASLCWLRSPSLNPLASGFVPQTPHLQGLCALQTLSPHVSSSHSEAFTAGWGTLHSAGPGHRASSAGTGGGWSSGRGARTPDSRKPAQGGMGVGLRSPLLTDPRRVCTLRRQAWEEGVAGSCPRLWRPPPTLPPFTQAPARLGYRRKPLCRPRARAHAHRLSGAHLAGAGAPQVHAGPQPHAEYIEG